jgi:hypothetical protein
LVSEGRVEGKHFLGGGTFLLGRDAALRRHHPRSTDGQGYALDSRDWVAPLNAARTAQRAVPTRFIPHWQKQADLVR